MRHGAMYEASFTEAYRRAGKGLIDCLDGVKLETPQTFINELSRIEKLC
jgi:hypothetical protein